MFLYFSFFWTLIWTEIHFSDFTIHAVSFQWINVMALFFVFQHQRECHTKKIQKKNYTMKQKFSDMFATDKITLAATHDKPKMQTVYSIVGILQNIWVFNMYSYVCLFCVRCPVYQTNKKIQVVKSLLFWACPSFCLEKPTFSTKWKQTRKKSLTWCALWYLIFDLSSIFFVLPVSFHRSVSIFKWICQHIRFIFSLFVIGIIFGLCVFFVLDVCDGASLHVSLICDHIRISCIFRHLYLRWEKAVSKYKQISDANLFWWMVYIWWKYRLKIFIFPNFLRMIYSFMLVCVAHIPFEQYWFKQKNKFCIVLLICSPKKMYSNIFYWKMCWNQSKYTYQKSKYEK